MPSFPLFVLAFLAGSAAQLFILYLGRKPEFSIDYILSPEFFPSTAWSLEPFAFGFASMLVLRLLAPRRRGVSIALWVYTLVSTTWFAFASAEHMDDPLFWLSPLFGALGLLGAQLIRPNPQRDEASSWEAHPEPGLGGRSSGLPQDPPLTRERRSDPWLDEPPLTRN